MSVTLKTTELLNLFYFKHVASKTSLAPASLTYSAIITILSNIPCCIFEFGVLKI